MSAWDVYTDRIQALGGTKRNASLNRECRNIRNMLPHNLSFNRVDIDGEEQDVAIVNSDNLTEKYVYSMPGEDIRHGSTIFWMDNYWLVTEKDANNTVYTRAKAVQCNYLLKWIDGEHQLQEQWCVVEDGTKYLTGEFEDRNFVVTRGDSRLSLTISRNEHTVKFNRECRFLIDDHNSEHMLAYALTKPLRVGSWYDDNGIYKFVLQEVNTTDDDNQELGIADYYKHFPKSSDTDHSTSSDTDQDNDNTADGRKVWL